MDIGKPVRKIIAVPLKNPVPDSAPSPKIPAPRRAPERKPAKAPEKTPA